MKKVIATEKLPIKLWLDDIEDGAMQQVNNAANLPFAFKHIAVMPDAHQGYGMPIGGVLATKGVIIPNAVGVDIACGVLAVQSSLKEISEESLRFIIGWIRERIPVGFKWNEDPQDADYLPEKKDKDHMPIIWREYEKARRQVGTLGGGNHFIEIQKGSDGYVWFMIHSGSRNIGKQVADHYNKIAVSLNQQWCSGVPKKWELAFLPMNTPEGKNYKTEMAYCVKFALMNRRLMMQRVQEITQDLIPDISWELMVNIPHNYAAMEHHFNTNVMVHRKGATQARKDQMGIIPGSQGTKSYIVIGKGNPESFMSCSHGAGRKMGRRQAKRELSLEEEQAFLDSQGILHSVRGKHDLDEAPGAYKDIDTVMRNQEDLVDIFVELSPLAVVKG